MSTDEESFVAFVQARTAALARTAFLLTGNHHDAEDLVQCALIKAAKHWHSIREHPEPYVRRVMCNENVSIWRKRVARPAEQLTDRPPDAITGGGVDVELALALRNALARLSRKQRTVLVLRFFEDLSERQTADEMGTSVSTVKSQTRYALARLRELSPEIAELTTTTR